MNTNDIKPLMGDLERVLDKHEYDLITWSLNGISSKDGPELLTLQVEKQRPLPLGIHIKDGVGTEDKVGG